MRTRVRSTVSAVLIAGLSIAGAGTARADTETPLETIIDEHLFGEAEGLTGEDAIGQIAWSEGEEVSPTLQELLSSLDGEARPLTAEETAALEESGDLAPREDGSEIEARALCGMRNVAVTTKWLTQQSSCAAILGDRNAKVTYTWERDWDAIGGSVCVTARGFRPTGSGAHIYGTTYWLAGGCSAFGSVTVRWYNTAAYKLIQFKATTAPLWGLAFTWH